MIFSFIIHSPKIVIFHTLKIGEIYIELFFKIWYFCDHLDVCDSNINLVDHKWKPIFAVSIHRDCFLSYYLL